MKTVHKTTKTRTVKAAEHDRSGEILRLPTPRVVPLLLSTLGVDETYQRALRKNRVETMLKEEGWYEQFLACDGNKEKEHQLLVHLRNCIGIVTVTGTPNGRYKVVLPAVDTVKEAMDVLDGQYRTALLALLFLRLLNFADVEVWCDVIESCTEEYAAELFRIRNRTKPMNATERFKSRLAAKQPSACRLLRLLTDNKIGVSGIANDGRTKLYGRIHCIEAFQTAFDMCGPAAVVDTINIVVEVWGRDAKGNVKPWSKFKDAMQTGCVGGLCAFFKRHPKYNRAKLVRDLGRLNVGEFANMCRGGAGWGRAAKACEKIEELYSRGKRNKPGSKFVR